MNEKIQERRAFDESEANCNTCTHLRRVAAPKCKAGFLTGFCDHPFRVAQRTPQILPHPDTMRFHPNDPMHMPCYVPRWSAP